MDQNKLKHFLINSAFGASAVRNQGKGMIQPIRDVLIEHFKPDAFFKKVYSRSKGPFNKYLDELTKKLYNKRGYYYKTTRKVKTKIFTEDKIPWGTARKCINLFLRNFVYNAFIWKEFGIQLADFKKDGIFLKLELPLDSYSIAGLKSKSTPAERIQYLSYLNKFTITRLKASRSKRLQELANIIAKRDDTCRVNLDVPFGVLKKLKKNIRRNLK